MGKLVYVNEDGQTIEEDFTSKKKEVKNVSESKEKQKTKRPYKKPTPK